MKIEDQFRVPVSVDEAWRTLLDIERIAPCLPGAQLQEIEGDEFRGVVKVKVGPITAQYKGSAKFDEVDEAAHRLVIRGVGRDTRGQGNASATVTLQMQPDGDGTAVSVDTDLAITGKVAQFGRGVMADVSAKLLAQFVENLERDVFNASDINLAEVVVDDDIVEMIEEELIITDRESFAANGGVESINTVRIVESAEVEPVDLMALTGVPMARRARVPLLLILVGGFVTWRIVRRRRRRKASATS